jgi:hypothetical protein
MQNKTLLHAHIQHYFKIFIVPLAIILLCAATSPFYSRSLGDTSIKLSPSQQNKLSDAMKAQTGDTDTPTLTQTETPNPTNTASDSPDPTSTYSETPTNTYTETPTETPTGTSIETPTETLTDTSTETPTETSTLTPTETPTPTATIETPELTPTPCEGPECPKPLMFIRNDGQYDPSIKFEMIGSNGSVVFTNDSILIAIEKPGIKPPWADEGNSQGGSSLTPAPQPVSENGTTSEDYSVVEIHFAGVNSTPMIDGENVLDTKISFFLGNDPSTWQTDIPAFTVIRYSGFAPGYDLEINGGTGTWVWKLVPNGNARSGLDSGKTEKISAKLNAEDGQDLPDLSLEVDGGDVSLEGDSIVVGTDAGNISLPLIQVPANTQPDTPSVDGNVVNSPYTDTGGEPTPTTMGYKKNGSNGWNQFLIKAAHFLGLGDFVDELLLTSGQPQSQGDASGDLVFSSFLGGAMDDQARDVAYGPDGSMYVTGSTMETSSWGFTGIRMCSGYYGCWSTDIFVARLNAQRQLASLTFIGGYLDDASSAIAVDESGNTYVVGNSFSPNFPMNSVHAPYQYYHLMWPGENAYATDIILFKLNPAMTNLLYATYLGGPFWEFGYGIAYDPGSGGNVYIVGDSDSPENYPPFIYSGGTLEKDPDGVLAGFNTNLGGPASMLTIKFFGGPTSLEQAHGVAVSPIDHSLWIIGQTSPLSGPVSFSTLNGFDSIPGGSFDAYIVHLAPAPGYAVRSSSFFGGSGRDCELAGSYRECDIAVDATGNAYITGTTLSPDLAQKYTQGGGFQAYGGGEDIFAAKVHGQPCEGNATAECMKLDYWRYLGGSAGDESFSIAVSAAGDAYITGQTGSPNFGRDSFPNTLVPDTTISGGDAFLVRLAPDGYISYFTYLGGTGDERAYGVAFLESAKKAVIVGGMPQALSGFPLVNPVDSNPGTAWEGFVSEFVVPDWERPPLATVSVISPTNYGMVLSVMPEFQWQDLTGADHYTVDAYHVAGDPSHIGSIHATSYIDSRIVYQSGNNCDHPGMDWCYKWSIDADHFNERTFKSGENPDKNGEKLEQGAYAFTITAYSTDGSKIGVSEMQYFQIPPLGLTWDDYKSQGFCPLSRDNPGCTMDNRYWYAYDDLFYKYGELYNIPPSMLKAIMIAETATKGAMIVKGGNPYPPHMGYGYEPGIDWNHWWIPDWDTTTKPYPQYANDLVYHGMPLTRKDKDTGNDISIYIDAHYFFKNDPNGWFAFKKQNQYDGYISLDQYENKDNYEYYFPNDKKSTECNIVDPLDRTTITLCPNPYNISIPYAGDTQPVTIYRYAYGDDKYASSFSNTFSDLGLSLNLLPGCHIKNGVMELPDQCVVNNKDWLTAQYRLSASYGLGMIATWNDMHMIENFPPEQYYNPETAIKAMSDTLQRAGGGKATKWLGCIVSGEQRTYYETDWVEGWKNILIGYNGGDPEKSSYYKDIVARKDAVQPRQLMGDTVDKIYPYNVQKGLCGKTTGTSLEFPSSKKSIVNLDWNNPKESFWGKEIPSLKDYGAETILDTYEYDFGNITGWVEDVYRDDVDTPGIGIGYIKIYSDESKTELLWQSPSFIRVMPAASWVSGTMGIQGSKVLLSQWAAGLHSVRYFPIAYVDGEFKLLPIFDEIGNQSDSFFSDSIGIYPYADGSIIVGQRDYEGSLGNQVYVYRIENAEYHLQKIINPSNMAQDVTPPHTDFQLDRQPNESGWSNTPVTLHLSATDDKEIMFIRVSISQDSLKDLYSPLSSLDLPFPEGIWQIGFQSYDWAGNEEPLQQINLKIDQTPPISTVNIQGEPDSNGKYPPGTRVEITAMDPKLVDGNDGSGVKYIEYSLDSTDNWTRYSGPIEPQTQGLHTIYFRAIDEAGNIEQTRSVQLEIKDTVPPVLTVSANPLQLWPPNNKLVPVKIFGTAFDTGSGIKSIHIQVIDEYGTCQPAVPDIGPGDIINGNWIRTIQLEASRQGNDKDGRKYTIRVMATDNAGNTTVKEIVVIVPHDQGH